MKIWFLEIGEPLPLESGVRLHRVGNFSKYLAAQGHKVTWWTSSFSHAPKKHIVSEEQTIEFLPNLTLRLLKGMGYPRNISFKRFAHQRDFAKQFALLAPSVEKPDVIVASIPTLEASSEAVKYAMRYRVPYVVDVRDRWPQEFVDLLPKPARWLGPYMFSGMFDAAKFICQNATAITGVSSAEVNYGMQFTGRAKEALDVMMPLGYQTEKLPESELRAGVEWADSLGIRNTDFNVCFFGTIGRFFDLETIIAVAREVKDLPIKFILAGTGGSFEKYQRMALDLKNVIFPGWIKAAQIQAVMARASVGLAPYRRNAIMTMPNKPFEYMSGALPVLFSFKGELADILTEEKAGLYYTANDAADLKTKLLDLYNNRTETKVMGERAHQLYLNGFTHSALLPKYEQLLQSVVVKGPRFS